MRKLTELIPVIKAVTQVRRARTVYIFSWQETLED